MEVLACRGNWGRALNITAVVTYPTPSSARAVPLWNGAPFCLPLFRSYLLC